MRQEKSIKEKVQKEYPEFVEAVDGLSVDALEKKISTYAKELEKSEQHKKDNEALKNAAYEKSLLEAPYRDVKKAIGLKVKYLIDLIGEKGGEV